VNLLCALPHLPMICMLNLHIDQIRDVCDHHFSYPHDVCSYCQSFEHDVNCYPYYDVSDESYTRLSAMMETMNEQLEHFGSEMRDFGLLSDTDSSLPVPRLETSLYDDCESF